MWVKTAATLLCFPLGLFLITIVGVSEGTFIENERISIDENSTRPETTISQGTIRGINMLTHNNRTVYGFIGIPYAQPPIGDLRFKAPVEPSPWNGTLDASVETEPCPQFNDDGLLAGNEDCLHLNVFAPQLPVGENITLLPTMVYIIGGGFKTENNSLVRFGPDYLLDEDVLLVVPNFRVGVLGYLSTGDEVSPGNYGLKDMVRALEWIRDNIEYFGGDPNQVTLFGGSSGGMSTHLLALSNLTDGLFHKYITQSGTAIGLLESPMQAYADRAVRLAEYFDCPTNTSTLLVNCLRTLNASQLVDTNFLFYEWKTFPSNVWVPSPEPDIDGALLTKSPAELYAAGNIRDLPWISSVTRDEGFMTSVAFQQDPDLFEEFLDQIDEVLPIVLGYAGTVDNETAYTETIKSYYFNDLSANRSLLLNNLTLLMGDATFIYPAFNAFQQQLAFANNPLYFCSFEFRGTFSYTYLFSGGSTEYTEVAHGDETIYLFKTHDSRFGPSDYENTDTDFEMVDTMVQLWASFAINGTPTTVDQSSVIWEPFSSDNNYLRIGNDSDTSLENKYDFLQERMQFWTRLTAAASNAFRNSFQILLIVLSFCTLFTCI